MLRRSEGGVRKVLGRTVLAMVVVAALTSPLGAAAAIAADADQGTDQPVAGAAAVQPAAAPQAEPDQAPVEPVAPAEPAVADAAPGEADAAPSEPAAEPAPVDVAAEPEVSEPALGEGADPVPAEGTSEPGIAGADAADIAPAAEPAPQEGPIAFAEIPNDGEFGFLNPRTTTTRLNQYERVQLAMEWRVPPDTQPGDTIAQALPPSLNALSFQAFDVLDGAGRVIARATLGTDAAGNPAVVFTFNDNILLGGAGAAGTASFSLTVDRSQLVWNDDEAVIDVYDQEVIVTRGPGTPETTRKTGNWRPNQATATAVDANGALIQTSMQLEFAIYFATDNPGDQTDNWTQGTFTEPPLNGIRPHCQNWGSAATQTNGFMVQAKGAGDDTWNPVPVNTTTMLRLTNVTCNADGSVSVSFQKPTANDGIYYRVYYRSDLETNAQGQPVYTNAAGALVVGFPRMYRNLAVVTINGRSQTVIQDVFAQDGEASGTLINQPAIDIEKYSSGAAWEGVLFDARGNPFVTPSPDFESTTPPDEDFDTAPGKLLDPGAPQTVRFTVTNIGSEALRALVIADATTTGPALTGISCDFSPYGGPAQGTDGGAAVLPRRAVLQCTATLPAMGPGVDHSDTVRVDAVGNVSDTAVTDDDPWHAYTNPVPDIDIEKYSGTWSGVAFAGGVPTLDGSGQPIPQPEGDFDTGALGVRSGVETPVRFTVTNTGPVALTDVVVTDTTDAGADLEDVQCTFPDGTTGTEWDGPFAPAASFECTATLPPLEDGVLHQDTAAVEGTYTFRDGTTTTVDDADVWAADTLAHPAIDVEKYNGAWDGVEFDADGNPVVDENGQPVPQPDGDFDEGAFVVRPGVPTPVTITVTNTGNRPLTEITVTDETNEGPALSGLECTFPDGSTGLTWAGPFEVGASFDCSGTVPALAAGDIHDDTVTATGKYTYPDGSVVYPSDRDKWRELSPIVLPEHPPVPPTPLALTGGAVPLWALGLGAGALLTGILAYVFGRRREQMSQDPAVSRQRGQDGR